MMHVGQDFDPAFPVRNGRVCVDVRAQRRGPDGYRAAIYLPSRAGQVRVAVDIPPGTLRALQQQYATLLRYGEEAEVAGIDFLEALPELQEGDEFIAGLESLLGPALGLLGPLLGGGGGGGLESLLGGLGGGGGGGGGLGQLLQLLQSGGLGQGAQLRQQQGLGSVFDRPGGGGFGGALGGLGQLGGQTPSAPGLGGLLGGILGGIPILGPLLGPLFGQLGQLGGPQKPNTVERGAPTAYVEAARRDTPYPQQQAPQQQYAGPPVWGGPQTPQGGVGTQPTGFEGRINGEEEEVACDYCGEIPPLEGAALALGEALGAQAMEALPFLAASHVISDALREVHLNPHRFGTMAPELSEHLARWLAASDNYAAAAVGHPEARENLYRAANTEKGQSALQVVNSMLRAPRI